MPKGFTLVEILITIAIIGLATALAIPNITNFSQSQDVTNSAIDLKNLIRKAQSNAQSGVVCSTNQPAYGWDVWLFSDRMELRCRTGPDPTTQFTLISTFQPSAVTYTFPCSPGPATAIYFDSNTYNSNVMTLAGCTDAFLKITLTKTGQTPDNVYVTTGGSIYESVN